MRDLSFLDPNEMVTRQAFNVRFQLLNLENATAALFGLGESAVPDDVLKVLSRFQAGLGNDHIWKRTEVLSEAVPAGYTLGEVQTNVLIWRVPGSDDGVGGKFGDTVSVDDNGLVTIPGGNYSDMNYSLMNTTEFNNFYVGRFVTFTSNRVFPADAVYYIPSDASITKVYDPTGSEVADADWVSGYNYYVYVSKIQRVTGYAKKEAGTYVDYVNSPNANAYSGTDSEGRIYEYLGQLGGAAHIATGSYTGTGTTSVTLNFDFPPKMLHVIVEGTSNHYPLTWIAGASIVCIVNNNCGVQVTQSGNTLTLTGYNTTSAQYIQNVTGTKYYYIAIG